MPEQTASFTRSMRRTHTIYMPDMLHYHNDLLKAAFRFAGYRLDVVPEYRELTQSVYRTVYPDYCTCAVSIVGNLLSMAEDTRFADKPIAFLEPQMGGACRAGAASTTACSPCLQRIVFLSRSLGHPPALTETRGFIIPDSTMPRVSYGNGRIWSWCSSIPSAADLTPSQKSGSASCWRNGRSCTRCCE